MWVEILLMNRDPVVRADYNIDRNANHTIYWRGTLECRADVAAAYDERHQEATRRTVWAHPGIV